MMAKGPLWKSRETLSEGAGKAEKDTFFPRNLPEVALKLKLWLHFLINLDDSGGV